MSWHFRGSLARIEFERHNRVLLPFIGCAWLAGDSAATGNAEPDQVHDAHLELVRHDDLMIRAITAEHAEIAERTETPVRRVAGCLYYLGGAVRIVAAMHAETTALIQRTLLAPLAEGRFYLNAAIEFSGFAPDDAARDIGSVSRRSFYDGQGALYFDLCSLTVGFNDWECEPALPGVAPHLPATRPIQPRL